MGAEEIQCRGAEPEKREVLSYGGSWSVREIGCWVKRDIGVMGQTKV